MSGQSDHSELFSTAANTTGALALAQKEQVASRSYRSKFDATEDVPVDSTVCFDRAARRLARELRAFEAPVRDELKGLLDRISRIVREAGLDLYEPDLMRDPEGTVDLVWNHRPTRRVLSATVIPHPAGSRVWVQIIHENRRGDHYDPSDQQLERILRWMARSAPGAALP